MLMLSRRQGETIRIGDNISITVLKISSNQVKLGLEVPKIIPVHREEIYQRILIENNSTTILGQSRDKKLDKGSKKVRANAAQV